MNNTAKPIQNLTHLLLAMFLAFSMTQIAIAQPDLQTNSSQPHITAALQASTDPVPGQSFILALNLTIAEDWHTYWPGINDTGYGISLKFAPVEGLTFGHPLFPTPKRHLAPGNILDHIYENEITIYILVDADDSIAPGDSFTVDTVVNYLICKQVCIPESATASIALKAASPKAQSADEPKILNDLEAGYYIYRPMSLNNTVSMFHPEGHTTYTKVAGGVTGIASDPMMDARYFADNQWQENEIQLTLNGATHYIFFPDNNCTQPADLIKQGDAESDTLTITFDRRYEDDPTTPAVLSGRLLAKFEHGWREFDIHYIQPQPKESTP